MGRCGCVVGVLLVFWIVVAGFIFIYRVLTVVRASPFPVVVAMLESVVSPGVWLKVTEVFPVAIALNEMMAKVPCPVKRLLGEPEIPEIVLVPRLLL